MGIKTITNKLAKALGVGLLAMMLAASVQADSCGSHGSQGDSVAETQKKQETKGAMSYTGY